MGRKIRVRFHRVKPKPANIGGHHGLLFEVAQTPNPLRVFVIKSKTHHDTLGGESLKMLSEYAGSNGMELIVLTMPTGAGFEIFEEKGGRGSGNLRA